MGPNIRKRSKWIMGPRLMDRSLRTLPGNKDSDTERLPLGGLKLMVTWSVSRKTLTKSARISKLEGKAIREGVQRTVGNYCATPHPARKESPDMLMFGRELRRKLPERIVPAGEIPYGPIRQRPNQRRG